VSQPADRRTQKSTDESDRIWRPAHRGRPRPGSGRCRRQRRRNRRRLIRGLPRRRRGL